MKNLHFRLSLALLCLVIQVGPSRLSTNLLLWLTEQQMILMVFSFFYEREKREVVVIMSLQKYVLPFEHAQASEYLHCSGKSPSLGLKVKFHFSFAIVWRVKIAGKLCFRQNVLFSHSPLFLKVMLFKLWLQIWGGTWPGTLQLSLLMIRRTVPGVCWAAFLGVAAA